MNNPVHCIHSQHVRARQLSLNPSDWGICETKRLTPVLKWIIALIFTLEGFCSPHINRNISYSCAYYQMPYRIFRFCANKVFMIIFQVLFSNANGFTNKTLCMLTACRYCFHAYLMQYSIVYVHPKVVYIQYFSLSQWRVHIL